MLSRLSIRSLSTCLEPTEAFLSLRHCFTNSSLLRNNVCSSSGSDSDPEPSFVSDAIPVVPFERNDFVPT